MDKYLAFCLPWESSGAWQERQVACQGSGKLPGTWKGHSVYSWRKPVILHCYEMGRMVGVALVFLHRGTGWKNRAEDLE